jgi:hypothetical protein
VALWPAVLRRASEESPHLFQAFWHHTPPCPLASSLSGDQTSLCQDARVVRDRGLTFAQWTLKVAAADLALRGDDGEQTKPNWIGHGGQHRSRLLGLSLAER